ncbi:hypothetical protein HDE_04177 [Halotydeus destructor]|nr:hypothetical protein HDE_04177 [Halotydeus destructor]
MENFPYFTIFLIALSSLTSGQEWIKGPTRYEYLVLSKSHIPLTYSEAESGCRKKEGSLPSLSFDADYQFVKNTLGLSSYYASSLSKVVNDEIKQVWPDNVRVKTSIFEGPCQTSPLKCIVLVFDNNFYSITREVSRQASHVCQRRVLAEDRQIAGINAMDYLLIDSPMNYANSLAACLLKRFSLASFSDPAALGFLTEQIGYAHTYWTRADLSEDGVSFQWSAKVPVGKGIVISSGCRFNMQKCKLGSLNGKLTVMPDDQIASIVICARYRNAFKYVEDIPITVNKMTKSMANEAIAVSRKALKAVKDVQGQVTMISQHFDNTYGLKWNCSIDDEHGVKLATQAEKRARNFIQFITDGAVVTLYQTVSKA